MNKKNIFFSFLIIVIFALGFLFWAKNSERVQAGTNENVYGWAWSENIGWISFNNTSGEGTINYGVHIDPDNGNLSGYAWSENIGWISFDRAKTSNPLYDPFKSGSGAIAKIQLEDTGVCGGKYQVCGWARALSGCQGDAWDGSNCTKSVAGNVTGGWDGWISLRDNIYHGVYVEDKADPSPDEFMDWAWGGGGTGKDNAVIGWISFNCADRNICGTGPGKSDYKVLTDLGSVVVRDINLSVTEDGCTTCGVYYYMFSWNDPPKCDLGPEYTCEETLTITDKIRGTVYYNETVGGGSQTVLFPNDFDSLPDGEVPTEANLRIDIRNVGGELVASGEDSVDYNVVIPAHAYPCVEFTPPPDNWDESNPYPLPANEEVQFCTVYEKIMMPDPDGGEDIPVEICKENITYCYNNDGSTSGDYCKDWGDGWIFPGDWSVIPKKNPLVTIDPIENNVPSLVSLTVYDKDYPDYVCTTKHEFNEKLEPTQWIEI